MGTGLISHLERRGEEVEASQIGEIPDECDERAPWNRNPAE